MAVKTLDIQSGTATNPWKATPGTYDMLWGNNEHDAVVEDCLIRNPPDGEFPKMFGCDRITFRRCEFSGIRVSPGAHVEGIHMNGCRDILFEDTLFDDNDVFHVFLTSWGGYPFPARVKFVRCRFGNIGPFGGFFSVMSPQGPRMEGLEFVDCQRTGPVAWPTDSDWPQPGGLKAVPFEWPPFETNPADPPPPPSPPPPPPPVPVPPAPTIEARLALLEETVKMLGRPGAPLDTTAAKAAVAAIRSANPKIAASDTELLALITTLATR